MQNLKEKISAYMTKGGVRAAAYDRRMQFSSAAKDGYTPNNNDPFFKRAFDRINDLDTYNRFKHNYIRPNTGTELIADIWRSLSRVWKANDSFDNYFVRDEARQIDFSMWHWWRKIGWKQYQLAPNSVGVVYFDRRTGAIDIVPIFADAIRLIEEDEGGVITEFAYEHDKELHYFGDGEYRRYDAGTHALKDSVAGWWRNPSAVPVFRISASEYEYPEGIRGNAISNILPQIEDLVFEDTLRKINVSFAHANMVEVVASDKNCGYSTPEGNRCQGGWMADSKGQFVHSDASGAPMPCPSCNSGIGVGKVKRIPIASQMDGLQPLQSVRFVTPDVTALKFSDERIESERNRIYSVATGRDRKGDISQALNSEMSILASLESQKEALDSVKSDIQPCFRRMGEIIGDILIGPGNFSYVLKMGDNYMLHSTGTLLEIKKVADEMGVTEALGLNEMLVESTHGENMGQKKRASVVFKLAYLVGAEAANRAIVEYELENGNIAGRTGTVSELVKELRDNYISEQTQTQ